MKYMRYLFASIIIGIILLLSSCFNGEIEDEYTTETMFPAGIDEEYTIETMFSEELRRATTVEVSDKVLFDQLIITDDTAEMLAERISDYLVNDTHPFEDFDDIKKMLFNEKSYIKMRGFRIICSNAFLQRENSENQEY